MALLAAIGGVLISHGLTLLVRGAMERFCTPRMMAPDYWTCFGRYDSWIFDFIEYLAMFLFVGAFAVTFTLMAPTKKRLVALLCALLGVAVGAFSIWDTHNIADFLSTTIAGLSVVSWAFRKYPRAHVA